MRLPEFVTELSPVRETLEAMSLGEEALSAGIEEALRQLFPDTADRGLELWEADFSLMGGETEAQRRALIKAALARGQTLTPAYLAALCRAIGGGDWSQVNEDVSNDTVTAYAAAYGQVPPGAEIMKAVLERIKPAHLAVELHPAGVFALDGGWRSALTGGTCAELSGESGETAPMPRRIALSAQMHPELSGDDGTHGPAVHRVNLHGVMSRETQGGDILHTTASRTLASAGGTYAELWGSTHHWNRSAHHGIFLTGSFCAELSG